MERWLKKNLRYIAIILLIFSLFKTVQSCNRKMSIRIQDKNLSEICDSIVNEKDKVIVEKNIVIDSLENEITIRDFMIKDYENELKIAGVKVNEAEKRAESILSVAEKIKTNTTIEVKGVEEIIDSTKNIK